MLEIKNITPDSIEGEEKKQEFKESQPKFDAKNYLDVKLKNGEKKEKRIRLLPFDAQTGSPFKIIHMHNTKVDKQIAASGYKNYVCLRTTDDIDHDKYGTKCPFCELRKEAYAKLQGSLEDSEKKIWEEIYRQNKVKDVCIVRCIERGAEEDGPKYWKFNLRNDNSDPKNEIVNIYNNRKMESIEDKYGSRIKDMTPQEINEMCKKDGFKWFNVLDVYEGKDLKLVINPVYEKDKLTNKTNITITDYGRECPLSTDDSLVEKWINDDKKWTDVFGVKDYDYLSLIIEGKIPFFDKTQNKWVAKEEIVSKSQEKKENSELDDKIKESRPQTNISLDIDNDLPF
jgi:hypothetical protein